MFSKIRNNGSLFVGRQLSRFKLAISYITLAMTFITAAMTTKSNYPQIEFEWILAVTPVVILLTLLMGYFLDRFNISTQDQRKSNEMTHRYLLTSDLKSQDYQLTQTKMLLMGLKNIQSDQEINVEEIMEIYKEYKQRWSPPK